MSSSLTPKMFLYVTLVAALAACTNARIKSGDKYYDNLSYSKAISSYQKALNSQPDNNEVKLKLASSLRNLNNSADAEIYYREVAEAGALQGEDRLHYAQVLMKNNKYNEAKTSLEAYIADNPDDKLAQGLLISTKSTATLKEDTSAYILTALPLDFTVSMFGPAHYGKGIALAAETEITSAANTNPWTGYAFLDMYYMEKTGDGSWTTPKIFSDELNGRYHDGPATFNAAQDMIIYTRSAMRNQKKQLVNEKRENQFYLYQSKKVDGKWAESEEMPFNNQRYSVGHPSLSPDGKTLYFSSDMLGGYGGSDIYKSTFDGTSWSQPINLGSNINTAGNEVFPYISKTEKLYFSSEGHQTLGGLDVFLSENVAGSWAKPVNLAYPLNSSRDDFAIIFNDNDSTGYVSSDRSGGDMIYEFQKVAPKVILDGIAVLKTTDTPVEGVLITLINLTDGDTARISTGTDGKFKFNLLTGKSYKVKGEKEGFFNVSEEFKTSKKDISKKLSLSLVIEEIISADSGTGSGVADDGSSAAPKTYNIGEVFYDYNEASIRTDAKSTLDKLVTLLLDNPKLSIEIHSHCDSRGGAAYNLALSKRRAESVVQYLGENGISDTRLRSKGFGSSQPVNRCRTGVQCSEEEHQANRRTEFIVLPTKNL